MAFSVRNGLVTLTATGDTHPAEDVNQPRYHAAAIARFMAARLGGEGIYSGGASVIGDITTGTDYPALDAIVYDDSGQAWMFRKASATAMTFSVTSGACTAYLIIGQVTAISPAMATGGLADFTILVQLTATAAPAHSLPLGAGTVTASAFTTWTPDAAIFVAAGASLFARRDLDNTFTAANTFQGAVDLEGALTIQDAGNDHDATIAVADLAAARAYTIPDAGGAASFVMNQSGTIVGATAANLGVASSRAYLAPTSDLVIGDSSVVAVDWTGHSRTLTGCTWDSGAPTRLTIAEAGVYLITALATWAVNATGQRQLILSVNGTDIAKQAGPGNSATYTGNTLTTLHTFTAADYLTMSVYQSSGGDLNVTGSSVWTYLHAVRIAP